MVKIKKINWNIAWLGLALALAACAGSAARVEAPALTQPTLAQPTEAGPLPSSTPAAPAETPTPPPAATGTPAPTTGPAPTATPDTRPQPREWASWPVIPTVSAAARDIYRKGIEMGNNPSVFSTVGDCQSEPNVFMGIYETDRYSLGDQAQLQETIDHFRGSFTQKCASVRDGLSAPSALSPLWSDPEQCQPNEIPVACELRLHKPVIMFINLGTNWKAGASAERYGEYLRQIVEMVIANGTVPVLSTKADNVEGDHSLNRMTAQVAYEYDIPLWNFWLAADSLPNHGLDSARDNIYLTPEGWNRRNFTALQTLDAVWRALSAAEPAQ